MRYCLSCRHFSAAGPLCTQCGRSFGGRLCNSKKRHLNPPDAQFCGHCGTADLTNAASYLPLGCSARLVIGAAVLGLLWWGGSTLLLWSRQGFSGVTGYRSPFVWAIEKSANVLIILFVFYFLSMLMPGQAGAEFRALVAKLCTQTLQLTFQMIGKIVTGVGRILLRLIGGEKVKP